MLLVLAVSDSNRVHGLLVDRATHAWHEHMLDLWHISVM